MKIDLEILKLKEMVEILSKEESTQVKGGKTQAETGDADGVAGGS